MTLVDINQLQHILLKSTDFFGDNKKFKPFLVEHTDDSMFKLITDVQLQCLGYGHFDPDELIVRFDRYVKDVATKCKQIKSLKIILNGFDLLGTNIINSIAQSITLLKDSIKILWFHTSHLEGCNLIDFSKVLNLTSKLGNHNFQQISLHFSSWKFEAGPPSFATLEDIFKNLLMDKHDNMMSTMKYKKFRLEISGWFYNKWEAKRFLGFALEDDQLDQMEDDGIDIKNEYLDGYEFDEEDFNKTVTGFHKSMKQLVDGLLHSLPNLQDFQVDFRHWNQILKLKELKKQLDNLKKQNTIEKSLVSKKQHYLDQDEEQQLRMIFVV